MAAPPVKNTAPRATSVLNFSSVGNTVGGKPSIPGGPLIVKTFAWVSLKLIAFSDKDVVTDRLPDTLRRLQENILNALGTLITNPVLVGNVLRGITFTAAQTQYLTHGLNRPWQGYVCVRAQTNPAALTDVALAPGQTADRILPILSANAGTYDIYVF